MVDVVIDVGHGRRPNGTFDPGTIAQDGTREHDQAHIVTRVAREALERSRVSYDSDDHGSGGLHDPNWSGSVNRINRLDPKCAVEVHFDWNRAPRGGFGIHHGPSRNGKRLAAAIAEAYRDRGLTLRYDGTYADTRGLAFVRSTECPAVIWECDRVGAASGDELRTYGEAIAEGICAYLGVRYQPPSGREDDSTPQPQPRPDPKPTPAKEDDVATQMPFIDLSDVTDDRRTWKRGEDVKTVQGTLVARGFAPRNTIRRDDGSLDGVGGPGTRDAVRAFQRAAGIGVDGKVGKNTWGKLLRIR